MESRRARADVGFIEDLKSAQQVGTVSSVCFRTFAFSNCERIVAFRVAANRCNNIVHEISLLHYSVNPLPLFEQNRRRQLREIGLELT